MINPEHKSIDKIPMDIVFVVDAENDLRRSSWLVERSIERIDAYDYLLKGRKRFALVKISGNDSAIEVPFTDNRQYFLRKLHSLKSSPKLKAKDWSVFLSERGNCFKSRLAQYWSSQDGVFNVARYLQLFDKLP